MTIQYTNEAPTDGVTPLKATLSQTSSCRKFKDAIYIKGDTPGWLRITFQRTIRVPHNQEVNDLPPSMGTFPLYSVANFQATLPPKMAVKGGIFFPMYQREAMWINFSSHRPFAIKVFLGGVNAVSGEPLQDNDATMMRRLTKMANNHPVQDYVVTPNQLWIDGIATEEGLVRQFVAMPLGSGYSVEAQVTGQEISGGMQFLVVPSTPKSKVREQGDSLGCREIFVQTLTGKRLTLRAVTGDDRIDDIKELIRDQEGIPVIQQRLLYEGKQLNDDWTIDNHKIEQGSTLYLALRLRGGGGPTKEEELGIAPGGLIKQCILADTHPASTWDMGRALSFNVQILNSDTFRQVTGFAPPETPVSAQTYAMQGLPYFKIYHENSSIKGDFGNIKSVEAMDKLKAANKNADDRVADEPLAENPVILLNPDGSHLSFKPVSVLKEELSRMNHAQF